MADAPTPEQRRRVARLSAADAAAEEPNLLQQVKLAVAEVDALDAEEQTELVDGLSQDWGRLFRGCTADKNRARYSIYRRARAQLEELLDELETALEA